MKRGVHLLAVFGLLALFVVGMPSAMAAPSPKSVHACTAAPTGFAHCHALVRTDVVSTAAPAGYGPSDLQSAYKLNAGGGSGQTVAIVDAYDDPRAESDLAVYRSQFGLPACTTANGCFRKVDQNGGTHYPRGNTGWAEEISLDLDMVSAI